MRCFGSQQQQQKTNPISSFDMKYEMNAEAGLKQREKSLFCVSEWVQKHVCGVRKSGWSLYAAVQ